MIDQLLWSTQPLFTQINPIKSCRLSERLNNKYRPAYGQSAVFKPFIDGVFTLMSHLYHIALPVPAETALRIHRLTEQLQIGQRETGQSQSLATEAGQVMSEVGCQLIDVVFGELVQQFLHVSALPAFRESLAAIEEVKTVLRKYLPWAISFFGNERLAPVAKHYADLIQSRQIDGLALPFLVFALPESVAQQALRSLEDLEQHRVKTATNAIEALIQVIDVSLEVLLKQPKTLLKFNFVVDKTLNGVINVTTSMSYKNLRKLGQQLDPSLFDALTNHLRQFLIAAAPSSIER